MTRKPSLWKSLGLTEVKSPSGRRKGFTDASGNYISERQFRKEIALTPLKGSQGYKERQAAKAEGRDFRPVSPARAFKELAEAARQGGMTLAEFTTGKPPEPPEKRTLEAHNKWLDEQREEAVKFKRLAGVLTDKQAEEALKDIRLEKKWRDKALAIQEKIRRDKKPNYKKLEEQYHTAVSNMQKAQKRLEKKGIISTDESPTAELLRNGYYHAK